LSGQQPLVGQQAAFEGQQAASVVQPAALPGQHWPLPQAEGQQAFGPQAPSVGQHGSQQGSQQPTSPQGGLMQDI